MHPPEVDLLDRRPIWDALQMLYMDIDPVEFIESMVGVCAESKYTLADLEAILFQEVLPACRSNMLALPAPEWRGFEIEGLTRLVLEKHRFGRRKPIILRAYTKKWWLIIEQKVQDTRVTSRDMITNT